MDAKISVIIPLYHEAPGILRRAVQSVCAQTGLSAVSGVEVIVADDGLPVNAAEDALRSLDNTVISLSARRHRWAACRVNIAANPCYHWRPPSLPDLPYALTRRVFEPIQS